ncbi:MAG: hypothetical protein A3A86_00175 [Elusimicrobia bacterium RIFCSPLOWO2_01_FULL_60_11]|nr:MAG: hypothetical protein A3A86_00175 [Elusimicrobia bacterium RIFCSPLOWO2_01_FULL_60_11]
MVSMIILFLFVFGFLSCAQAQVLINEVASEEPPATGDWVEFYVAGSSADLSGWKVFEQNTPVKTFPSSATFQTGSYFLLHFNSSAQDGAADFRTTDPGLTGTSNVITLRNAKGLLMDAVVFSDDSSWTSVQQQAYNLVVASGQWVGARDQGAQSFSDTVNIPGGIGAGNSIGRGPDSADSDREGDWIHLRSRQTPGSQNSFTGPSAIAGSTQKIFRVTQSPFSPLGDGPFREAHIHCVSEVGSKASVKIFDIQGRMVRALAERAACGPESVLPWDGRDAGGAMVPSGIYIVGFEVRDEGGGFSRGAAIVVVARKL